MSNRALKVYGILNWVFRCPPAPNGNRQARCVVAARRQAEAAQALGVSLHHFRQYGSETSNTEEVRAALAEPGVPLWLNPSTHEFERLHV